jgi:hypothetical protein
MSDDENEKKASENYHRTGVYAFRLRQQGP